MTKNANKYNYFTYLVAAVVIILSGEPHESFRMCRIYSETNISTYMEKHIVSLRVRNE